MRVQKALAALASEERRLRSQSFFKTGPGQYAEGDIFIGVSLPDIRAVVKEHPETSFTEIKELLASPIHEERMAALIFLCKRYPKEPEKTFDFYVKHLERVNNWDLVDVSAPSIVGAHLFEREEPLYEWAESESLWVRRIAVVATQYCIRKGRLKPTFKLARMLLDDKEDLMHKAVGWMLREAGKKDEQALISFLERYEKKMPRTMFRYAIERLPSHGGRAVGKGS
ncbi:MAG: DNA alkylation repair protein [Chlamydiia bacterium]|nr:DNA alkylation repair protein [Chlamydiia bacterium]